MVTETLRRVKAGRHRKWQWLQAHCLERNHAVMTSLLLLSALGEGEEREEEWLPFTSTLARSRVL